MRHSLDIYRNMSLYVRAHELLRSLVAEFMVGGITLLGLLIHYKVVFLSLWNYVSRDRSTLLPQMAGHYVPSVSILWLFWAWKGHWWIASEKQDTSTAGDDIMQVSETGPYIYIRSTHLMFCNEFSWSLMLRHIALGNGPPTCHLRPGWWTIMLA